MLFRSVQIAEFEHRYKAKGYEQTIIEFKTDPRLNTGETYINEINSIDRIKKRFFMIRQLNGLF